MTSLKKPIPERALTFLAFIGLLLDVLVVSIVLIVQAGSEHKEAGTSPATA